MCDTYSRQPFKGQRVETDAMKFLEKRFYRVSIFSRHQRWIPRAYVVSDLKTVWHGFAENLVITQYGDLVMEPIRDILFAFAQYHTNLAIAIDLA